MNIKEWGKACEEGWAPRRYDNASRQIQKSLKYNPDPNATVRHHLRDTEEQRKYNDEHYELWGFEIDENGDEHFEYGKYVIFVTKEEHTAIHALSDETRKKIGNTLTGRCLTDEHKMHIGDASRGENNYFYGTGPNKGKHFSDEHKKNLSEANAGKKRSDEAKQRMSNSAKGKHTGKNNGMYGRRGESHPKYGTHHSDETRKKISESNKGRAGLSGEKSPMYGKHLSDETCKKISESLKGRKQSPNEIEKRAQSNKIVNEKITALYKEYKLLGGMLSWNDFRKELSKNKKVHKKYSLEGLI